MLAQCEAEFNGMKRGRGEELKLLNMHFLISDLMDANFDIVREMGFTRPDTILASYIIYWANDKLGTMQKFHDLLAPGGKLIVVEEAPLVVTPSPHMPASLIEGIKQHIRVIPLDDYYRALQEVGFEPVENGEKVYEIDDQHSMYGRVFIKT
jgi:SAM-dependent methyltransferase